LPTSNYASFTIRVSKLAADSFFAIAGGTFGIGTMTFNRGVSPPRLHLKITAAAERPYNASKKFFHSVMATEE
jgi:hypothetical protein